MVARRAGVCSPSSLRPSVRYAAAGCSRWGHRGVTVKSPGTQQLGSYLAASEQMQASQRLLRPREVRLIGVLQLPGRQSVTPDPPISAPPHVELVWRHCKFDEVDDTLDLVLVCAVQAPTRSVARIVSRIRANGWTKPLVLWIDRRDVTVAPQYAAAGATDFICADSDACEAASRLHAALLQAPRPRMPSAAPTGVTLDWKRAAVLMGEVEVRLTLRELRLLDVMLQTQGPAPGRLLAQKAWGVIPSHTSNLVSVCVCNLRKKLARFGSEFGIRTHRGLGYSAEVRGD